jgi:hypothetical protein
MAICKLYASDSLDFIMPCMARVTPGNHVNEVQDFRSAPYNLFTILLRERDRDSCAAQNAHVLEYIPLFALLFIPLTHARYRS